MAGRIDKRMRSKAYLHTCVTIYLVGRLPEITPDCASALVWKNSMLKTFELVILRYYPPVLYKNAVFENREPNHMQGRA